MSESFSQFGANLCGVLNRWGPAESGDPEAPMGPEWFADRALHLFRLQFASNAAYRTQCEGSGIGVDSIRDWRSIPAVPAAAFKELTLTCLPVDRRPRVFFSSGTTGHLPSRHYHDGESLALYEASLWSWFRYHLAPRTPLRAPAGEAGLVPLFLTPAPSMAPHSSLVHMLACVARHLDPGGLPFVGSVDSAGAWHVALEPLFASLTACCQSGRAVLLAGTAFGFVHLLDHMAGHGKRFHLPAGSRIMETGGYKGRSRELSRTELHDGLADRLGIPRSWIVSEYGMSELSSQAYDTVAGSGGGRRFRFPPWARAMVVSVETGREVGNDETGLLRIVDLANAWSVMSVQTEDLAVRRGDGFDLLGRAPAAEARGCSLRAFDGN